MPGLDTLGRRGGSQRPGSWGRRATFARGERYVSGGVLMGLGVATALSRPGRG
jgi:hypothetical protein